MSRPVKRTIERAPPHRVLALLRALWVIVQDPMTADMRTSIEAFADRVVLAVSQGDAVTLRTVGDEILDWARRNRHRLSLCIEESSGGDVRHNGFQ